MEKRFSFCLLPPAVFELRSCICMISSQSLACLFFAAALPLMIFVAFFIRCMQRQTLKMFAAVKKIDTEEKALQ